MLAGVFRALVRGHLYPVFGKLVYENFFLLRVDVDACGDVGFHLVLVELRCFLGGERLGLFLFRGVSPSGDPLDWFPFFGLPVRGLLWTIATLLVPPADWWMFWPSSPCPAVRSHCCVGLHLEAD
ncbi:hypothetical protein PQI66_03140 [Corynebacterium sp. USCH3]|uniref:hypothetical protein n=1 Tax=Corynebacterium sp. USCH3 TaxID=3024840 RepID=UPI0030A8924C